MENWNGNIVLFAGALSRGFLLQNFQSACQEYAGDNNKLIGSLGFILQLVIDLPIQILSLRTRNSSWWSLMHELRCFGPLWVGVIIFSYTIRESLVGKLYSTVCCIATNQHFLKDFTLLLASCSTYQASIFSINVYWHR